MANMFPVLNKEPSEELIPHEEETEEEAEPAVDEEAIAVTEDIIECFQLFDTTKSGKLDVKYLDKALYCLGINLTDTELEELTESIARDGTIIFDDFQNYAHEKMMMMDSFEALKKAFQAFDVDNEGVLPSDRLKRWMTTLGNPLTDKEAKELLKLADPGNKGYVVYDDLVGVLLN